MRGRPGPIIILALAAVMASSTGGGTGGATGGSYGTASSSYQSCVIQHESSGDATVVNSIGAGGLYQFLPSTWATTPWGSQYSGGAQTAPVSVQNQAFQWLYARQGTQPWRSDAQWCG